MNQTHSGRYRFAIMAALVAAAGFAFHQDIIGRVAYAVEKGKLDAGEEHLAKVQDISEHFRLVAKQVKPAVVQITTRSTPKPGSNRPQQRQKIDPRDLPEPFRQFFGDDFGNGQTFEMPQQPVQQATGSGVIIDAEKGLIVTNNHVVSEGDNVETRLYVHLPDGRRVQGKVLGTDRNTDLALVQIKAGRLHAAPLGDSAKMEVGDWVLAVGAPFGLDQTVTQGIISATGRSNPDIAKYGEFLQTDAAINPGNSGGPLVNMHGEVIGINTAIATNGLAQGYMGVGFAIPSNMVKDVIPVLEKGEEVVRGYIGVQIRGLDTFEGDIAKTFGLKDETGVLVEDVMSGTPAAKAGLKMDDVILTYDGKKMKSADELRTLVAHTKPDTQVDMQVWRDGKEITVPITIEKQPKNFFDANARGRRGNREGRGRDESGEEVESTKIEAVGITVEPLTDATAKRFGWTDDEEANDLLVVTQVEPLGEAAALGVGTGDLIVSVQGQPIKSVAQLKKALSKPALASGVRIKVKVPREGYHTLYLQVNP